MNNMKADLPWPELVKRIRDAQRRAQTLWQQQKYTQLLSLNEGLSYMLKQLYCLQEIPPEKPGIRRAFDKDQLCLLYNKAVILLKNNGADMAIQVLMQALKKVQGLIEEQKVKLGYMDKVQEATMYTDTLESVRQWQLELARFYFYLSSASYQTGSQQVSLASALKSLDIVRQLYEHSNRTSRNKDTDQKTLEQTEELLTICEIRDRLSHRRRLQQVQISSLIETINWLLKSDFILPSQAQNDRFLITPFGYLSNLTLNTQVESNTNEYKLMRGVTQLHCLLLRLLSSIEDMGDQDNFKNNNTRNMLLNAILAVYICKRFLPPSQTYSILSQYNSQFHTIHTIKEPLSIDKLVRKLRLTPEELRKSDSLSTSVSDMYSQVKVQISRSKSKKKNSLNKTNKSFSRHFKSKEKSKKLILPLDEQQKKGRKPKPNQDTLCFKVKAKQKKTSKKNNLDIAIQRCALRATSPHLITPKRQSASKSKRDSPNKVVCKRKSLSNSHKDLLEVSTKKKWK